MSISTSIHFGQLNTNAEKWGFYLSKATLKYIEDFISPFWWGGVLFATVLSHCQRHAAFARNTRDVNLNSAHWFLAEIVTSLVPVHEQMAWTSKFSNVNICITCICLHACVIVTRPPDKAVIFSLIDEFGHIYLIRGDNHLIAGHLLFLPLSLNSLSRTLWHCPDISRIPSSPDKSCSTIIFTDFMQGD